MCALSRRAVLRGAGGIALGLPFLEAMLGRNRSVAQSAEIPRRVVFFFTSCGPDPDAWWPQGEGTDFTLGPSLSPLEPFRHKLLIPDNIGMKTAIDRETRGPSGNGHDNGTGHCLTARPLEAGPSGVGSFGQLEDGTAGGISVDQHIAHFGGNATLYRSLEFGVEANNSDHPLIKRICWDSQKHPIEPMKTSGEAFDRIFAPLGPGGQQPIRLRRRELVLGAVKDDLARLRAKLGAEDRRRIDAHMASIADISSRLDQTAGVSCAGLTRVDGGDNVDGGRGQLDLIAEALKCDLTRVVTMQWSTGQSGERFRWLGHDDTHHGLSHQGESNTGARRQIGEIDRWYATELAHLLGRLDALEAGDGKSVLDYTTVIWVNEQEQGIGNHHDFHRMPYVLAGSGGGFFKTGRYHKFAQQRGHGELFVSLMQMMGMQENSFGHPKHCAGALSELHV